MFGRPVTPVSSFVSLIGGVISLVGSVISPVRGLVPCGARTIPPISILVSPGSRAVAPAGSLVPFCRNRTNGLLLIGLVPTTPLTHLASPSDRKKSIRQAVKALTAT